MKQKFTQVKMLSVLKVKPHASNESIYSTADVSELAGSMKGIGEMLEPIIVTPNGTILSGHRRFKAAQEIGWEEVPVRVVDIPDEDQLIYLIAANSYRTKTWTEKAAELKALYAYADEHGKEALLKFLGNESSTLTVRQQMSKVIGGSEVYISRLQKIIDTNPMYIQMIDNGELSFNKAYNNCTKGKQPVPKPKEAKTKDSTKVFFCVDCPNKKTLGHAA